MKRILIIDDEEPLRRMLRQMLERNGFIVTEASNGAVGLKMHGKEPFDLIITDIFMPEKEGLETIREFRREFPSVKIIAMSGGGKTGELSYLSLATALGASRALAKPFERAQLLAAVTDLLNDETGK